MPRSTPFLYLLMFSGVAAIAWALATRIHDAETVTLHAYGVEIRAEGRLPSQRGPSHGN